MKTFFLASLLAVAASASLLEDKSVKFQAFKTVHGKSYSNQVEETKRFSIFRDNLRLIEEHNALYEQGLVSYRKKITQFADQTQEEFKAYLTLHRKPSLKATTYVKTGAAIPESVDWREEGQVTQVKNQDACGSCWAFSVTGSTEGAYYRKNGKLASLSEQQLVDCTTDVNIGCDGGLLEQTFPYVQEKGLQTEETYPYKAVNGVCKYDSSKVVAKVSSFVAIANDESALLEAVATIGPVSVAIDASYIGLYESGIFEGSLCEKDPELLNHGVLIVGYGTENGKDYWIVKNSWSALWGDHGYMKIVRGVNECGIADDTVYPLIN